jgi:hypothetical protein
VFGSKIRLTLIHPLWSPYRSYNGYQSRSRISFPNRFEIHVGDMERGVGKPPFFDGTNYPYWKIRTSAYLQSISYRVWQICLDAIFDATSDRITPIQMEFHDSNNKARNTLFSCLSFGEFERVGHLNMAHQIWSILERFHEGNNHVKTRLFET